MGRRKQGYRPPSGVTRRKPKPPPPEPKKPSFAVTLVKKVATQATVQVVVHVLKHLLAGLWS